jgi:hypothetical protein
MKSSIVKHEQKMESFYFSSQDLKLQLSLEKALKIQLKPIRISAPISLIIVESLIKEFNYLLASFNSLERNLKELRKDGEIIENLRQRLENQEKIINGIDRSYTEQINELKEQIESYKEELAHKNQENIRLQEEFNKKEEV